MGNKNSGCGCYQGRSDEPETVLLEERPNAKKVPKHLFDLFEVTLHRFIKPMTQISLKGQQM